MEDCCLKTLTDCLFVLCSSTVYYMFRLASLSSPCDRELGSRVEVLAESWEP